MRVLSAESVVVVDDASLAGLIVWWRLDGTIASDALFDEWVNTHGLDADHLPSPPGPEAALSRAMADQGGRRTLVRPLANQGGKALVSERVVQDTLEHTVDVRAWLDDLGRPHFEPGDHKAIPEITAAFDRHITTLAAMDIGTWLVKTIERLDGVRLRDTGGIYFLPPASAAAWRQVAKVLHAVSGHRVNSVPSMRTEDAVASILDAVTAEATAAADELEAQLGLTNTARKARNRVGSIEKLAEKLQRYESLLGSKTEGIRDRLETLHAGFTVKLLQQEAVAS